LIRDLPCKLQLHEIGNSVFDAGPFRIQSSYIIHPGPTVGYRVKGKQGVFTYIPDHEPALGSRGIIQHPKWISGFEIAEGADVLYHDAQYTLDEYKTKRGWGHSTMEDAGLFASLTSVKQILFAHHDPSHTDAFLNGMLNAFKQNTDYTFKAMLAKEGLDIEL
jgi:phosphoribosyl 1,2-cyclic phosphodiesterase